MPAAEPLADLILRLVAERGAAKSICPSEAARAHLPGDPDWHRAMPAVRAAAVGLARAGRIAILRKGRPVDPDTFKGVYRLGPVQGAGNSAAERPDKR